MARLLQLILALRSGRYPNANQLASFCEVSRRTIYRDLDALVRAGVPVRYRHDRQGYELGSNFFLEPTRLEEDEVAALLLRSHQGGPPEWPSLRRKAEVAALKCAGGLPEGSRRRVLALAELLEVQRSRPEIESSRLAHYQAIFQAILDREQLRLRYRDPCAGAEVVTKFSVYRLLPEDASWRLVGRSSYHRGVRFLPLSWIERAEPTGDSYEIPPRFRVSRLDEGKASESSARGSPTVRLLLPSSLADQPEACPWPPAAILDRRAEPDGQAILTLDLDDWGSLTLWVLGQGQAARILGPDALRAQVHDQALRVAQAHATGLA